MTTAELMAFIDDEAAATSQIQKGDYYLPRWRPILEGKTRSGGFNGAVAFVGPLWFLYRKLLAIGIPLFSLELAARWCWALYVFGVIKVDDLSFLVTIATFTLLLVHITLGFVANRLYLKKAIAVIGEVRREASPDSDDSDQLEQIRKRGGTSVVTAGVAAVLFAAPDISRMTYEDIPGI